MIAVEISLILCPCSLTTENPEGVSPFMCFTMGFLHVLMVTRCRRGNMNKHSKKHMIPLNPTKSHLKHQRVISKKKRHFSVDQNTLFMVGAELLCHAQDSPSQPACCLRNRKENEEFRFGSKDLVHQYFIVF